MAYLGLLMGAKCKNEAYQLPSLEIYIEPAQWNKYFEGSFAYSETGYCLCIYFIIMFFW